MPLPLRIPIFYLHFLGQNLVTGLQLNEREVEIQLASTVPFAVFDFFFNVMCNFYSYIKDTLKGFMSFILHLIGCIYLVLI